MIRRLLAAICGIILVGAVVMALLPGSPEARHDLAGITWYTEEYPPYNYEKNGTPAGIAVDILHEVLTGVGTGNAEADIRVVPWSEGYQTVLRTPMTVVFSTARTPERENLFKWAGPLFSSENVLYSLKKRNVTVSSLSDLATLRIGIIRDDIAGADLLSTGVSPEELVVFTDAHEIVSRLESGEIDAWAYAKLPGIEIIRSRGEDPTEYEPVYSFGTREYYFAFNRDVPDELVREFQSGLDRVKGKA